MAAKVVNIASARLTWETAVKLACCRDSRCIHCRVLVRMELARRMCEIEHQLFEVGLEQCLKSLPG